MQYINQQLLVQTYTECMQLVVSGAEAFHHDPHSAFIKLLGSI